MTTFVATAADQVPERVVRRRYPARWAAAGITTLIAILALVNVFTNKNFGWNVVWEFFRDYTIFRGLWVTLWLTAVCMAIGIALALLLAVMRLSPNPVLRSVSFFYVWLFRGTPVLVQLLFWFNLAALYPHITFGMPGVRLDANQLITPAMAAVLGLGLNEAAYMSEIVRAGIKSVPEGQHEACAALGLSRMQTLRKVVLPQAMRVIIPPTGNEVIGMLKTTSLVSVLAVPDLLYSSQLISTKNFQTIPLLLVASIWYLMVTSVLSVGQYYLERRFSRGSQRS